MKKNLPLNILNKGIRVSMECRYCGKNYKVIPSRVKKTKYCSGKCSLYGSIGLHGYWNGKKRPDLKSTNAKNTMFSKEQIPWNKGLNGFLAGEKSGRYVHGKSHTKEFKAFYERNRNYRKKCNGGNHTYYDWLALKWAYGNKCIYCGKMEPEVKITEDHVIPLIKGGTNNIENIQPLCFVCNSRKGSKEVMFK